jgi:hypothetical protein
MRLGDIARLIRSKNAGPFTLTIDLLFDSRAAFDRAVGSGLLTPRRIAELYGVDPALVRHFELPDVLAIKISLPRRPPSGAVGDSDIYGCQAMAPLAALSMGEAQS